MAAGPTAAHAQPTNDDFSAATAVDSLPFVANVDTTDATSDPSDPTDCYNNGSVWFAFTPTTDMRIQADTFGSDYDTVLSAWTGTQGSLNLMACNDDYSGTQSKIDFPATAGTTYHFMVGQCCGNGGSGGGALRFAVTSIRPAVNDDFADAITIDSLPYPDVEDFGAASGEPGEPDSCFPATSTVWYAYTPSTTQSITATVGGQSGLGMAAYTGTSLTGLSQVDCSSFYTYDPLTFVAQAGTTYLFQVGSNAPGEVVFRLDVAPNPTAEFSFYTYDPSVFDTVQFSNYSGDPAGVGISAYLWDFGDGTTSTADWPTHRYAADGDYVVRLTVTTSDGRTASTTHTVQVRTHDVSIQRLNVPATARVGQTIGINVYLQNVRYPENVRVTVAKSTPEGFVEVGSLTQEVAVRTTGQLTRFSFSYTVTSDDLALGKITFRATAVLTAHRDALPGDNELLSSPVKIS
ncbi:PKD domain-containing protein [Micromonospora costi]|uniref:PKD domain-containing protein n=1 Tax=Micromonospora costi TaxID=1530042 RepID=UPI001319D231|nr:PKD domain-containing protein [Micromonospora costi]